MRLSHLKKDFFSLLVITINAFGENALDGPYYVHEYKYTNTAVQPVIKYDIAQGC